MTNQHSGEQTGHGGSAGVLPVTLLAFCRLVVPSTGRQNTGFAPGVITTETPDDTRPAFERPERVGLTGWRDSHFARSSSGRTPVFGAGYGGSNPSLATILPPVRRRAVDYVGIRDHLLERSPDHRANPRGFRTGGDAQEAA